ncbi:MAG: NUDIX hydrolase [Candidatus Nitrosopolaris sp.]|jgi:8-oxo-dGTP pyrophosphatase MutT (NUDIX family)
MASDWRIIQSELLFQNRWIELYEDKVEVRTGNITHYTWYKSSDVAIIVPFLNKDTLVMIRRVLLEFPAGHIEDDEDSEKTARRELLEETGYHAKEIKVVYTYNPSVNISKQIIHVFRAKDLIEGEYKHDSVEDIRKIEIVAVEELKHMIIEAKVENAGTLIGYLLCCTGILSQVS